MSTTSLDLGNNETISRGIAVNSDGTFTALTYAASKEFKTRKGAERWLERRGFELRHMGGDERSLAAKERLSTTGWPTEGPT
jgi:hypothetical protein